MRRAMSSVMALVSRTFSSAVGSCFWENLCPAPWYSERDVGPGSGEATRALDVDLRIGGPMDEQGGDRGRGPVIQDCREGHYPSHLGMRLTQGHRELAALAVADEKDQAVRLFDDCTQASEPPQPTALAPVRSDERGRNALAFQPGPNALEQRLLRRRGPESVQQDHRELGIRSRGGSDGPSPGRRRGVEHPIAHGLRALGPGRPPRGGERGTGRSQGDHCHEQTPETSVHEDASGMVKAGSSGSSEPRWPCPSGRAWR